MTDKNLKEHLTSIALRPLHFLVDKQDLQAKHPNWGIEQIDTNVYRISLNGIEMGIAENSPNGRRLLAPNNLNLDNSPL